MTICKMREQDRSLDNAYMKRSQDDDDCICLIDNMGYKYPSRANRFYDDLLGLFAAVIREEAADYEVRGILVA